MIDKRKLSYKSCIFSHLTAVQSGQSHLGTVHANVQESVVNENYPTSNAYFHIQRPCKVAKATFGDCTCKCMNNYLCNTRYRSGKNQLYPKLTAGEDQLYLVTEREIWLATLVINMRVSDTDQLIAYTHSS
jgi:hypothetical protein